jgi:16S rRNA (cytidine1402-2'-O)-methyltransferase
MTSSPATLYIVATPLGNLEDLTFRAARILGEVDLLAAEDTRQTRKLLTRYGINTPLRPLHGHSRESAVAALVRALLAGQSIAYVSDAGSPGVSDPGAELVAAARAAGVPVVPLPGPSAPATAMSVSGLPAAGFLFAGYVPRAPGERREFLRKGTAQQLPLILFEAPHRIVETLAALAELVPERQIIICREMTKQFEQIAACPAAQAPTCLTEEQIRGEFTLVVEGAADSPEPAGAGPAQVAAVVRELAQAGVPRKTIAHVLQELTGMSRNEAYRRAMDEPAEESP